MPIPITVPDNIDGTRPITLVVKILVKEEKISEFTQRIAELKDVVRDTGSTLSYRFIRAPVAKDGIIEVLGFEEYKNKAALEDHFRGRAGDIIETKIVGAGLCPVAVPEFFQEL